MSKTKITKDSMINEIVQEHPFLIEEFFEVGMMCVGCHRSSIETIEQGCLVHGLTDKQTEKFVEMLNKKLEKENEKKNKKNSGKKHV